MHKAGAFTVQATRVGGRKRNAQPVIHPKWLTPNLVAQHSVQGLGLVFVAVYQRALKLLYVDALLERLKAEFAEQVGWGCWYQHAQHC